MPTLVKDMLIDPLESAVRVKLFESEDGEVTGGKILARIIRPCVSGNNIVYTRRFLKEQVFPLMEGTPCFMGHERQEKSRSPKDFVGRWKNSKIDESDGSLTAELRIPKESPYFYFVKLAEDDPSNVGVSIDLWADCVQHASNSKFMVPVTAEKLKSVDFVMSPAAGGGAIRVLVSMQDQIDNINGGEINVTFEELLRLKEEKPEEFAKLKALFGSDDASELLTRIQEENKDLRKDIEASKLELKQLQESASSESNDDDKGDNDDDDGGSEGVKSALEQLQEQIASLGKQFSEKSEGDKSALEQLQEQLQIAENRILAKELLDCSPLPGKTASRLFESLIRIKESDSDKVRELMQKRIDDEKKYLEEIGVTLTNVKESGESGDDVGNEEQEKEFTELFEGLQGMSSLMGDTFPKNKDGEPVFLDTNAVGEVVERVVTKESLREEVGR